MRIACCSITVDKWSFFVVEDNRKDPRRIMWSADNSGGTSSLIMTDDEDEQEEEIPIHGPEEPLTSGYRNDIGWYFKILI